MNNIIFFLTKYYTKNESYIDKHTEWDKMA